MSGDAGARGRTTGREALTAAAFREELGEPLERVLDLSTWRPGRDPAAEYERILREVQEAVTTETAARRELRQRLLPLLMRAVDVPDPGVHRATPEQVVATQQGLLFNGGVEAVDGTNHVHDTLAVTIYQHGISLVSYAGHQGTWQHQLFRRDLRVRHETTEEAVIALLERREQRAGLHGLTADPLSELARRGVTSYMERFVLTHEATAPWRMGHGSPAPMELIAMGCTDLVICSIRLVRELIAHERFVYVASEQARRALLMIGQALDPLEYCVIGTLKHYIESAVEDWKPAHAATVDLHWDADDAAPTPARDWLRRFRDEVAPNVVFGLYRATRLAPPQLFFAHVKHFHTAARIALADSVHLEQRGFPMLIDIADGVCRSVYGGGSLREMAEAAYARAGAPFCFQSERTTRFD